MTPFKRPDRPREGYRVWPKLPPPWGRVGPWQTGFQNRRQADQVEAWIHELALTKPEVLDALVRRDFSLRAAWVAKLRGTLDDLVQGRTDPRISDAAVGFSSLTTDSRVQHGLAELSDLADAVEQRRAEISKRKAPAKGALRLSWLLEPANVNEMYSLAVGMGRTPNSVRRSIHRAVADLLAHHHGKARRNDVMADVIKPANDDTREVRVAPDEIGRVLREFDTDFSDLVALAMLLAVDRGPLLRITPRYFNEAAGVLEVLDTKTASRPRTIELSTPAWGILRRRCAGLGPDDRVFPHSENQVRHLWESGRDRAAGVPTRNRRERGQAHPARATAERILAERGVVTLPVLRFKDLRHLLPTAWNALGFPEADLQEIMGHAKGSQQTRRYITARVSGERDRMDQVATALGLDRLHLRAAGG